MIVGITIDRKAYAWVNQAHDDYHIIEYVYTNTGNSDDDEEIELANQTLKDTYFFRIHRWRAVFRVPGRLVVVRCGASSVW